MKIQVVDKIKDEMLTQHPFCRDTENNAYCIHNDIENTLLFSIKRKIDEQFYIFSTEVKFCPYCQFSYQPERSKREDCKCPILKRYTLTGTYQGEYYKCRCGALNIEETQ